MQRLKSRIILEVLEDERVGEEEKSPVDPRPEPVTLTDGEQTNFILSVLGELNTKVLDLFNYLTPYMTDRDVPMREGNVSLLQSIYEDISLMLGKIGQGIKENSPEPIQQAIDDGQTQTQETVIPETTLEEGLDPHKERMWDELMRNVDMGDFLDHMQEEEEEERRKFLKDPKKELQRWKEYYREDPEMLDRIKAFEDDITLEE